jgi:hypothetical protein
MQTVSHFATAGATVLVIINAVYADDNKPPPATNNVTTVSTPAPQPAIATPTGTGLVNDWLRGESDFFRAWDLGGQFRAREEHKENFAAAGQPGAMDFRRIGGDPDNTYLLLRSKLHLGYSPLPWFGAYVEARNSSSTGDDRNPNPESDGALDLHQGYISLGNTVQFPLTAKIGRQELIYGDERLVGTSDWLNVPRVFDAAKLRFETKDIWVDAFVSRPVLTDDNNFNTSNDYEYFSGVYASTRTLVPRQETQLYFLARNTGLGSPTANAGATPQAGGATPRDIYTIGLRVKSLPGQFGGWDYEAELAGQFGRYKETVSGPSLDHEAFAAHVAGGYTWKNTFGTPRLGLEYNFASGDSDPTDGKHETFDNLFPTNHKSYGYMDFVSLQNIHNLRVSGTLKPTKQLTVTLDGHAFWLADTHDSFYTVTGARRGGLAATPGNGYGINPNYSSYVGSEVDLIATYAVRPYAILQGGYGHFFVGGYVSSSLASLPGGATDTDYLYAQFTFNF